MLDAFSRPVPKSYVTALEGHAASLELFIQRLAGVDDARRDELLSGYFGNPGRDHDLVAAAKGKQESMANSDLVLARARTGQLRKLRTGNATQFFGGTSLFHIHASDDLPVPEVSAEPNVGAAPDPAAADAPTQQLDFDPISFGIFPYSPHHEMCQHLMANFFGMHKNIPYLVILLVPRVYADQVAVSTG